MCEVCGWIALKTKEDGGIVMYPNHPCEEGKDEEAVV